MTDQVNDLNNEGTKHDDNPAELHAHAANLSLLLHEIQADPSTIRDIADPDNNLQFLAVNDDPDTIQFIHRPSEALQRIALRRKPETIQFFINLASRTIRLSALALDPKVIRFYVNATTEEKEYVIRRAEENWDLIVNKDVNTDLYLLKLHLKRKFI